MKCLLTGANGLLGSELSKIGDQYGLEFLQMAGKGCMDITRRNGLLSLVSGLKDIEYIIHCAAFTDVPGSELKRKLAIDTNVIGTRNIVEAGRILGAKITYISTDYVYPGLTGGYNETDSTSSINFYAWTKLAGEAYLDEEDLIIRTSFKPSIWKYPRAFNDVYTSADYVDIIAAKVSELIKRQARGIYNVGTERKSIYELALRRNPNVLPRSRLEETVRLPGDSSMCLDKYDVFVRGI